MDAEISELGSGIKPADCLIWRANYQISVKIVKKERAGMKMEK